MIEISDHAELAARCHGDTLCLGSPGPGRPEPGMAQPRRDRGRGVLSLDTRPDRGARARQPALAGRRAVATGDRTSGRRRAAEGELP
jgi:hypothetical protein